MQIPQQVRLSANAKKQLMDIINKNPNLKYRQGSDIINEIVARGLEEFKKINAVIGVFTGKPRSFWDVSPV